MTTADTTTIRRWAHDAGLTTSARGRLPAKIVDAYSAAHPVPTTKSTGKVNANAASAPGTSSTDKATAKRTSKSPGAKTAPQRTPVAAAKGTSAKKQTATGKPVATAAAAPKKLSVKTAAAKTPAAPVNGAVRAKNATPRPVKTVAPARRAPVKVASLEFSESSATAGEFAPLHRLVALEQQVADLTSRLAAVQNRSAPASSNDPVTVAKPTRKSSRR